MSLHLIETCVLCSPSGQHVLRSATALLKPAADDLSHDFNLRRIARIIHGLPESDNTTPPILTRAWTRYANRGQPPRLRPLVNEALADSQQLPHVVGVKQLDVRVFNHLLMLTKEIGVFLHFVPFIIHA